MGVKDEDFADGIYELLKGVNFLLGGGYDYSTGIDYQNDVFQTWSFWAHSECDCSYQDWEWSVDETLEEWMNSTYPDVEKSSSEWWRLYNMEYGNVTQGNTPAHEPTCSLKDIGFKHFASGLEVSWYKRVGRSTESNKALKSLDWFRIVVECLESLKRDFDAR